MKRISLFLFLASVWLAGTTPLRATTYSFNNSPVGDIVFSTSSAVQPTNRVSSVYPSVVTASGIPAGTVTAVRVTLHGMTVLRPDDIEMLLISPSGAKFVFWADAGSASFAITNITVTLDDAAAILLPDQTVASLTSGSYRPSCVDAQANIATEFALPPIGTNPNLIAVSSPGDCAAPRGVATFATRFGGAFTTAVAGSPNNPNGAWSLHTVDDTTGVDSIHGTTSRFTGWSLAVDADVTTVATTTTLGSSAPSSTFGNSVTLTATVRRSSDSTAVTSGTVTFTEGATTLAANVALNGSGQAAFVSSAFTEGDHTVTATYNPAAGFLTSNNSLWQRVDRATVVSGSTFSNSGTITVPATGTGAADVYPSRVSVSGLSGSISKVTLRISGLTVDRPDDVELLLVSPGGATFVPLGDAGGTATPVTGINLVFDDAAGSLIADTTAPASGTYKPSSYDPADDLGSAPAVATPLTPSVGPYLHAAPQGSSTFAQVFNGAVPNGTWSLYLYDDVIGGGITIANGWSLTFTTTSDPSTTTALSSSPNPSLTGTSATFTATVDTTAGAIPVTSGTVTFREGATVLAANIALNGAGVATFSTSSLTEGNHIISADYNGVPGSFNLSTSSPVNHLVDGITSVVGQTYCNTTVLSIPATANVATIYPSHINVASLSGPVTTLTVQLTGVTVDRPDDLEFLLVGPNGNNLVFLSDAGGVATPVSGINLIFSDSGANFVPDAGPLSAGTYKPTSIHSTAANFPTPAPASGLLTHAAPFGSGTLTGQFSGSAATGAWSLYAMDDVTGGGITLNGGWCLAFTVNHPPVAAADTITRDVDRSVKVAISDLLANDTDAEGQARTFTGVNSPSANGAAVHVVDSWVSYEAIPGNNATDSFTYTISDGTSTSTGTVTVNVQGPAGQTSNLVITQNGATVDLVVIGIPGRQYQFQFTPSLVLPITWQNLSTPKTTDTAGRATTNDNPGGATRFYRAILQN